MGMVISIKGLQLTEDHLTRFVESMADMSPTMEKIGILLTKYYSGEAFVSQGQVYDKPWEPLNPSTAAYKAINWPGRQPLVRTGAMQNGFGYQVTPLSVTIRNKKEYFEYQQNGTSRGIPPRMMMALNATLTAEATAIVQEDVALNIESTR